MHKVPPETSKAHIKPYFPNLYEHTCIEEQHIWEEKTIILLDVNCQKYILGPVINASKQVINY